VLGALVLTPAHIYIYTHIYAYVTYRTLQNITLHHVSSQNIANVKTYTQLYMNICVTKTYVFVTQIHTNDEVLFRVTCAASSWGQVMSHI